MAVAVLSHLYLSLIPTALPIKLDKSMLLPITEVFHERRESDSSYPSSDEDLINAEAAESHPLLPTWKKNHSLIHNRDLYMTPYSTIFSYWPAVVVIGGVGVVLFVLTVASLFAPLLP